MYICDDKPKQGGGSISPLLRQDLMVTFFTVILPSLIVITISTSIILYQIGLFFSTHLKAFGVFDIKDVMVLKNIMSGGLLFCCIFAMTAVA